jgi:uncharacterized repeat protein (TIGR01451 family)
MKRFPVLLVTGFLLASLLLPVRVAADRQQPVTSSLALLARPNKIAPRLLKLVSEGDPGDQYRYIVELVPQADLTVEHPGLRGPDRRQDIVSRLQDTAAASQVGITAFLEERQAAGQVQQIQSFWIFDGLAVVSDANTLLALAARPDVRVVREDRWRRWVDPQFKKSDALPSQHGPVEWNISRVRADQAWHALGMSGQGVTIAIMDTGVDWQHPALRTQYRGFKPDGVVSHQGNWTCTTDEGYLYPTDGFGHGTYVAGLAVGGQDSSGQGIGVAPGANWIAVKMLDNAGYGLDSWIHAAFEWIMAPGGDPASAPDVVNGSWGKTDPQDASFQPALRALRAAGIVPVLAIGNNGPRSGSLQAPASLPEAIAVGATDDLDRVASFSSRGPSPWGETKPEVAAPGAQIRSSLPGGTYGTGDGTSAAAPHVSGLAALLLQADPTLTVREVETLITSTAEPQGSIVPNNQTGWGRIDAYRATAAAARAGYVAGRVTRLPDGEPLASAQIAVYGESGDHWAGTQTGDGGWYRVAVPQGAYRLTAEAFGYAAQTEASIRVQPALTTTVNLTLSPLPSGVLWGKISDVESGGPVGAELSLQGTPVRAQSDPQTGQYSLVLPAGTYTLEVTHNGYRRQTIPGVELVVDGANQVDVELLPAPTLLLVDSGRWYYGSQITYFQQALSDGDYVYDLWEIRDTPANLPSLDDLASYDITVWSSPLDAPGLVGAGDVISGYLAAGGNLFLTGQDVGFWDGGLSGRTWHPYYPRFLKAHALDDDAGRVDVLGLPGEVLEGLRLPMNGPDSADNQRFPDLISVSEPRQAALIAQYGGNGGAALRASGCQSYKALYLAAGLEGLGDHTSRAETMDRTLTWLDSQHPPVGVELYPEAQDAVWISGNSVTYTLELRNTGSDLDRFDLGLSPSSWTTSLWDETFSQPLTQSISLGSCQTRTLGIQVTVPPDIVWNGGDVVTLTARSGVDPAQQALATLHTTAPAPILLVDDHLWYDTSAAYRTALEANELPYDSWRVSQSPLPDLNSPSLERLRRYPLVIWFTAYDWIRALSSKDEVRLAAYLDGGGRLLLSSQDYLYVRGLGDFPRDYLGVSGYTESLTATQVLGAIGSPAGHPFGSLELSYPFPNWSDALRPGASGQIAFWGQHAQPVALTSARSEAEGAGRPWKTVFFAFPLETLSADDLSAVMGQVVAWLSPLGDTTFRANPQIVDIGGQLHYTLAIHNSGPSTLADVSLSNAIPPSTTLVAGSLEGPANYDSATDLITWNGPLAPGQVEVVSYRLEPDAGLPAGSTIRNRALLRDESGLHIERVALSQLMAPDLSASFKLAGAEIARSGQTLTYAISLRNDGLTSASVQLVDPIPVYTTLLPDAVWASSGILTHTAGALQWSGGVPTSEPVTITFSVVISPNIAGHYILNRAGFSYGWGRQYPLESYTWVEAQRFLPLVLKNR